MDFPDYYEILGLPRFYPTQEEIRDAFLKKVVELNASGEASPEMRKMLDSAYVILSDAKRKREYDEILNRYVQFREPVAPRKVSKTMNFKIAGFIVGVLIIILVLGALGNNRQSIEIGSTNTTYTSKVLQRPTNGYIFSSTGTHNSSELQVVTSGTHDYFIKLQDINNQNRRVWFYVRGDSIANVNVAAGTYVLKYACGDGDSWYGLTQCFGKNTMYAKADDLFTFTDNAGWTVELYPHLDGNLETTHIGKDEF